MMIQTHALSALLATVFLAIFTNSWASLPQDDLVQAGDMINGTAWQKTVIQTVRQWDLAITGTGYFPLQDAKTGEALYTRLGSFELGRDGYVVLSGHPDLRLVVQLKSQPGSLSITHWMHLNSALMVGVVIDDDKEPGAVSGVYTDGKVVKIANLVLAKVFYDGKFSAVAPNIFRAEAAALPSLLAPPNEKGLGRITPRALEQL